MTNHRPMHFRDPISRKKSPRMRVNMLYMFFTVVCICFVCSTGTFQKDAVLNSAFDVIRRHHAHPPLRRHNVREEKQTCSKRHRQREKWSDKWFLRVVFTFTIISYDPTCWVFCRLDLMVKSISGAVAAFLATPSPI